MYKDLADAVESLKEKGFDHVFELGEDHITCSTTNAKYTPDQLSIVESHSFGQGTDPGSESTVHAIESDQGVNGVLILSYGVYVDPDKAKLIDQLLKSAD
jgi:hypothetical protein